MIAGNNFGAKDNSPISKWEVISRRTLNRKCHAISKCKCYSASPSPSRVKASDASDTIVDKVLSLVDKVLSLEKDVARNEDVNLLSEKKWKIYN